MLRDLRGELAAAEARAARLEKSLAAGFAERSSMGEQLAAAEAARAAAAAEKERTADQLSQVRSHCSAPSAMTVTTAFFSSSSVSSRPSAGSPL